MQLSVIIPTYNEVENIGSVVLAVGKALVGIDYEIIVSDDDSPDLTWACVEEIGKQNLRVRSLRRTGDRALSASVVDGFTQARGDNVACIDADLQHDASLLPAMLRARRRDQRLESFSALQFLERYKDGKNSFARTAARPNVWLFYVAT